MQKAPPIDDTDDDDSDDSGGIYFIIRMYLITPRRGNEPSAQGSALGERMFKPRPERAKATVGSKAYALSGRWRNTHPIPRALPWANCLLAFQAVCRIYVDNHLNNNLSDPFSSVFGKINTFE